MEKLLQALREFDALRDAGKESSPLRPDLLQTRSVPLQAPCLDGSNVLASLKPFLRDALYSAGIQSLYSHQADAIRAALRGEDVVLEAPTASGKTLAFAIPMFEKLLSRPNSHALLLSPMKALANDQRRQIEELAAPLSKRTGIEFNCWPFDGDTPPEDRKTIKESPPSILITNPEMLQLSFLGWKQQWSTFLSRVEFLVIDEIHEYRGFFGTNMALLLRRLLLHLHSLGAHPQIFMATATCANPVEHTYRLTGRAATLVSAAGAMRPERHFAFINPRAIPDFRFDYIYEDRIARASLACLMRGLSTIVFCPSRRMVESLGQRARRLAVDVGLDGSRVVAYRAGFTGEERRTIEEGLRDGKIGIVFSTNALELGIDIGRLDVCILAGFPDSVMSAWQRIGRVGRSIEKPAYVLFYGRNNVFDEFFASNLDAFLEKPLDELALGLDNDELMRRHLPYLLHESDWTLDADAEAILGDEFCSFARAESASARPLGSRIGPNYMTLNIRGGGHVTLDLLLGQQVIGTISDSQRFREAYLGAIYVHAGHNYRVVSHSAGSVELAEETSGRRTVPNIYTVVHVDELRDAFRYQGCLAVLYGRLEIFENLDGAKVYDHDGASVGALQVQDGRRTKAHSFWIDAGESDLPESAIAGVGGVEQLLRVGLPFVMPCDRHDVATCASGKAIYVYETVPGGIGIAERALRVWPSILKEGIRIAQACPCRDGCPRCIHPFQLKASKAISKGRALELAEHFLGLARATPEERLDPQLNGWREVRPEDVVPGADLRIRPASRRQPKGATVEPGVSARSEVRQPVRSSAGGRPGSGLSGLTLSLVRLEDGGEVGWGKHDANQADWVAGKRSFQAQLYRRTVSFWRKPARDGHSLAAFNCGILLAVAPHGIERNVPLAQLYLEMAEKAGVWQASQVLEMIDAARKS